jgi:hypothetical protein
MTNVLKNWLCCLFIGYGLLGNAIRFACPVTKERSFVMSENTRKESDCQNEIISIMAWQKNAFKKLDFGP